MLSETNSVAIIIRARSCRVHKAACTNSACPAPPPSNTPSADSFSNQQSDCRDNVIDKLPLLWRSLPKLAALCRAPLSSQLAGLVSPCRRSSGELQRLARRPAQALERRGITWPRQNTAAELGRLEVAEAAAAPGRLQQNRGSCSLPRGRPKTSPTPRDIQCTDTRWQKRSVLCDSKEEQVQ